MDLAGLVCHGIWWTELSGCSSALKARLKTLSGLRGQKDPKVSENCHFGSLSFSHYLRPFGLSQMCVVLNNSASTRGCRIRSKDGALHEWHSCYWDNSAKQDIIRPFCCKANISICHCSFQPWCVTWNPGQSFPIFCLVVLQYFPSVFQNLSKEHWPPAAIEPFVLKWLSHRLASNKMVFSKGETVEVWSSSNNAWTSGHVSEVYPSGVTINGNYHPPGTLLASFQTPNGMSQKMVPPESIPNSIRKVAACPQFRKGETVEVWSDSNNAWTSGHVSEVYPSGVTINGNYHPPGTLLASFQTPKGMFQKMVPPESIPNSIRKVAACPQSRKGETVEVWSDSNHAWTSGHMSQVYPSGVTINGNYHPPGTLLASFQTSSGMSQKMVPPDSIPNSIRKVTTCPQFSKGETVEVWSNSNNAWMSGYVSEVYPTGAHVDGYPFLPGTLSVSYETKTGTATKMVHPDPSLIRRKRGASGMCSHVIAVLVGSFSD